MEIHKDADCVIREKPPWDDRVDWTQCGKQAPKNFRREDWPGVTCRNCLRSKRREASFAARD